MPTPPTPIRPMRADEADLALLGRLFESNGDPKDPRVLRWRYLDNPTGTLFADFAMADNGSLAATYCVSPVTFRIGGRRVLGAQSIDTLTDARYRGKGLFNKLADATYGRCAGAGFALVYGFPNGSSVHGFYERLGWSNLDPVPFLIRPLRAAYVAERLRLPSWLAARAPSRPILAGRPRALPAQSEIRVVLELGPEHEALWDRFAQGVGVAVERNVAYLRWRFERHPQARYKTLALHERGALVGYAIFRVAEKHGGKIGYVMELLHERGRHDVGRALLAQVLFEMAEAGADAALAWSLAHSPNRQAYLRSGFVPLPERLRPIELHFGARHLATSDAAICNRRNWYVSYCDSDTV